MGPFEQKHFPVLSNVESIEINKREVAVEAFLKDVSPNEDIIIAESVASESPFYVSELYNKASHYGKSILFSVVFAFASGSALAQEAPSKQERLTLKLETTLQQNSHLKKLLGYDIDAIAKSFGRTVESYVPDTVAPFTIVHIEQAHDSSREENWKAREIISKNQKEVASVLSQIATPKTKVFVENFLTDDKEVIEESRIFWSKLDTVTTLDQVAYIYQTPSMVSQGIKNRLVGEKLLSLGFIEMTPLYYEKGDEKLHLFSSGLFPDEHVYKVSNELESGITSSAITLYAKGQIDFQPAEKTGGVRDDLSPKLAGVDAKGKELSTIISAIELDKIQSPGIEDLMNSYKIEIDETKEGEFALSTIISDAGMIKSLAKEPFCKENPRCVKITKEIIETDVSEIKKLVLDKREDESVGLIATQANSSSEQKVFPLVYGIAHDFTRAIKKWNKEHQGSHDVRFNLVTVKSLSHLQ